MSRGIKLLVGITAVSVFAWAQNQTTYKVMSGDTLSAIAFKLFPKQDVYGSDGKLNYIIEMNPDIKNPDLIFPDQVIHLKQYPSESTAAESVAAEQVVKQTEVVDSAMDDKNNEPSAIAGIDWKKRFYLIYGARYSSHTQDGLLGDAEVGDLSYKSIRAGFELQKNEKTFGGRIESYGFSSDVGDQQNLNYNLSFGFKKWRFLAGQETFPLFKVPVSGLSTLHDQSLTYLGVGGAAQLPFENEKVQIGLQGAVKYALNQELNTSQVSAGDVSGFGAEILADVEYLLSKNTNRSWHLNWQTDLNYWSVTNAAKTTTVSRDVKTDSMSVSTLVGVSLRF